MLAERDESRETSGEQSAEAAEGTGRSLRPEVRGSRALCITLALLSLCGMAVILLCTSRYGVGTSPDSAGYLGAARSLLAGKGYRYPDGGLYVQWPPLYPTLLAATGFAGLDPLLGARLLNSLAFGGLIFAAGILFQRCTTSSAWAVAGALSVLSAAPLLACYLMAWSEPVFILLAVLFVLCVPRFLRSESLPVLALVASLAGLACLQRYAGAALVLTGGVLIALSPYRASLLRRLMYLAIFGVIAATPVALWCVRNTVLTGQTAGAHHPHLASGAELFRTLHVAAQIVAPWLWPSPRAGPVTPMTLGLVVVLAAILVVLAPMAEIVQRRRNGPTMDADRKEIDGLQLWSVVAFGLIYLGFLVVSSAGLTWDPEERLMAPLYVFLMVLLVAGIDSACRLLSLPFGHGRLVGPIAFSLCMLWLLYPLRELRHTIPYCVRQGAGGYSAPPWQDSPLVKWLRRHPLEGGVYSNVPDALYLLTGASAGTTPHYYWDAAQFARREFAARPSYIVWFHNLRRYFLYDLRELLSRYRMEEVATFPDGRIYRFVGEGGPAVAGVYHLWCSQGEKHLYTIHKPERDRLLNKSGGTWTDGAPAFYAFPPDSPGPARVLPVYRFSSAGSDTCLYTMNEAEKTRLLDQPAGGWTLEGIAFYAWPKAGAKDLVPVHRFWSERLGQYFYTANNVEKDRLIAEFFQTWTYEGIAWYAYGPELF